MKPYTGEVEGTIVPPRGDKNFGWDSIFQPLGSKKTFGEMTLKEKNQYSHRAEALKKLKHYLMTDLKYPTDVEKFITPEQLQHLVNRTRGPIDDMM